MCAVELLSELVDDLFLFMILGLIFLLFAVDVCVLLRYGLHFILKFKSDIINEVVFILYLLLIKLAFL